jgi:hypothetical protein
MWMSCSKQSTATATMLRPPSSWLVCSLSLEQFQGSWQRPTPTDIIQTCSRSARTKATCINYRVRWPVSPRSLLSMPCIYVWCGTIPWYTYLYFYAEPNPFPVPHTYERPAPLPFYFYVVGSPSVPTVPTKL